MYYMAIKTFSLSLSLSLSNPSRLSWEQHRDQYIVRHHISECQQFVVINVRRWLVIYCGGIETWIVQSSICWYQRFFLLIALTLCAWRTTGGQRRHRDSIWSRADFRFALSQWQTALLCNDVSHWLRASLESALINPLHPPISLRQKCNNISGNDLATIATQIFTPRGLTKPHWFYWSVTINDDVF